MNTQILQGIAIIALCIANALNTIQINELKKQINRL